MASKLKGANSVTINEEIYEFLESKKDELLEKKYKIYNHKRWWIYSKQCRKCFG